MRKCSVNLRMRRTLSLASFSCHRQLPRAHNSQKRTTRSTRKENYTLSNGIDPNSASRELTQRLMLLYTLY